MGEPLTAEWWPRFDRGQLSWPIQGGQAGRSNFSKLNLPWQLGDQVVVLSFADWWTHYPPPNCGLERNSRLWRWHRAAKDLFRGLISCAWRFFFRWNCHRRVSRWTAGCAVFKSAPSWREEVNRHALTPERLLRTSAVSNPDVPTTYHKCVSWVFKFLSRTMRMPQQSRSAGRHECRHPFLELVPRSAHFPSQGHTSSESLQRELRPHSRFLLPVTDALGDEIAEASFGRHAERNTRIKNRYRSSCLC